VQILITKYYFGGSFGMSLGGECHEDEVIPFLTYLGFFGLSLAVVFHELYT
jgi:hypothetical protein